MADHPLGGSHIPVRGLHRPAEANRSSLSVNIARIALKDAARYLASDPPGSLFSGQGFQEVLHDSKKLGKIFFHRIPNNAVVHTMVGMSKYVSHTTITFLIDLGVFSRRLIFQS